MFDLRLGLVLGKSLGEVRMLPYTEIVLWRTFYLLEPWGFHDQEYRTAALLAQIHNANISKKRQAKSATFFMRNMSKKMLEAIQKEKQRIERQMPDLTTPEGRQQASEEVIRAFQTMFGNRVIRKDE